MSHVSSPAWRPHTKLYKLGLNFSVNQTWDLDMLYIYESSVTLHFVGFFRSTVSKFNIFSLGDGKNTLYVVIFE